MSPEEIDQAFAKIMSLKQEMQVAVAPMKSQMDALESEMREIMDPFVAQIQEQEEVIREAVLENQASFKGDFGKATFRKAYPRYSWDNKALEGYAAAGHEELFQFRKETMVQANVTIKAGE
ncbi:host-nuclease inhibitor Gam family protein [Methanococcoides sp. FTZ1]|uniref:host-nuclease inhibitor Gam family protein n=1 Tax=Methanococcoides sp. FTZ1 TaxID=3439061 RepID=UPI003F8533F3